MNDFSGCGQEKAGLVASSSQVNAGAAGIFAASCETGIALAGAENRRNLLRVCHLGKFYPPAVGGMEGHVQTLARAQAELGADVRVICVNHQDQHGQDVTWQPLARTPTIEDRDGKVRVTRLGRWASLARLEVCPGLPALLGTLRRGTIDILHLHVPNTTMLLGLAASFPSVPLVVTHHSDVIRQRFLKLAQFPFEELVYGRATRILATSPTYARGSSLLRRHAAKVQVLPLAIDTTPYEAPCSKSQQHAMRLQAELGTPLWLCVGRLVYYKGLHNAIEALARVSGKLLVIGQGPLAADLKARAQQLGLTDRIVWRDQVETEELIGAYHAATALWFPSNARSEGFGLVQVEAMASGCPVINTMIPNSGVSWVSKHEETGLTVAMNDPAALAAAANRLLSEPGLRDRLAKSARLRARERFGHMSMARKSLEIYKQLVSARGSGGHAR